MLINRIKLYSFLFLVLNVACNKKAVVSETKPNIIIFFTDDQGYADVGVYGAKGFETPHLDRLASEGIRFTDFYVPATVCTPSRASLLTGRYPKRSNLHEAVIFPYSEHGLSSSEFTIAEMLKSSGYATACLGKWHLGHQEQFMPNNHGFDYFYGVPYSNDMDGYFYKHNGFQSPPLPLYRNQQVIQEGPDQKYLTKMYTEETINFIQKERDQPFFIYLAHNMPHTPLHVSEDFKGKSDHGLYGDVIMELDWSVGKIVDALKSTGVYENTIFIFTSDNGPQKGSAYPLRGKKATTWEGGQRVPAIVTWPDKIQAKQISQDMVTSMDLLPTLAKIVDGEVAQDLVLDGMDISSILFDPGEDKVQERPFYYYARNGDLEAMRLGKWKLHIGKSIGWNSDEKFEDLLYNLEEDVSETENLADVQEDIVIDMKKTMLTFDASLEHNVE